MISIIIGTAFAAFALGFFTSSIFYEPQIRQAQMDYHHATRRAKALEKRLNTLLQ